MGNGEKSYTELVVWQKSRALVNSVYELTRSFPKEELFGLSNQMRRAAVSIPANIAEGCGGRHTRDTLQFLFIARGSLFEVETHCYLAADQHYISIDQLANTLSSIQECKKVLQGFIRYYRTLAPSSQVSEDAALYHLADNGQPTTDNRP